MNIKFILIILGEPNSTFSEILFKYFKSKEYKKNKKKIILFGSKDLIEKQMKSLGYKIKFNPIINLKKSSQKMINIFNIDYSFTKTFNKISDNSNLYIEKCFDTCVKILKKNKSSILINGPISKSNFLKKKFLGITEYIANKTHTKEPVMLIYNKTLSVSPLTTHTPLKDVSKFIKKKKILNNVSKIHNFYVSKLNKKPKIAILGLNPHCESANRLSEEEREIIPAIKLIKKKKISIDGPFPADTFFLDKNIKTYDVVVGMYHDQVLTPIKTLYKFNAINITIGLPFIKVTPDHGPNHNMIGKNISDPSSIFYAFKFINNLK